ncbi:MAG: hypothetical protein LRY75_10770 [Shewanella xiamenensis]|nr:hypothetical protein [Shewanella xiamenensis]
MARQAAISAKQYRASNGEDVMKSTVINLDIARKEKETESQFLSLLATDIDSGNVKPIPSAVFDRIAAIKHKALVARQNNELIEM